MSDYVTVTARGLQGPAWSPDTDNPATTLDEAALIPFVVPGNENDDGSAIVQVISPTTLANVVNLVITTTTGIPTISSSSYGKIILINRSTSTSVTLPADAPVGAQFAVMQYGSGQITLTAGSGASIRALSGESTSAQYGALIITCISNSTGTAAEWWVIGDATT